MKVTLLQLRKRFHQKLRACLREFVKQRASCLLFRDRHLDRCQHVTGIQSLVHLHNRYSGLFFAVDDRPLNRRRSTVFRKQRRVYIQTSVFRQFQDLLWNNLSVCCHHDDIRCKLLQRLQKLRIVPQLPRLEYRQSPLQSSCLDGGRLQLLFPSHRLVRLGDNTRYFIARIRDRIQCTDRKIRRAHKYNSHKSPHHFLSASYTAQIAIFQSAGSRIKAHPPALPLHPLHPLPDPPGESARVREMDT